LLHCCTVALLHCCIVFWGCSVAACIVLAVFLNCPIVLSFCCPVVLLFCCSIILAHSSLGVCCFGPWASAVSAPADLRVRPLCVCVCVAEYLLRCCTRSLFCNHRRVESSCRRSCYVCLRLRRKEREISSNERNGRIRR
jgi:hypothetical protein